MSLVVLRALMRYSRFVCITRIKWRGKRQGDLITLDLIIPTEKKTTSNWWHEVVSVYTGLLHYWRGKERHKYPMKDKPKTHQKNTQKSINAKWKCRHIKIETRIPDNKIKRHTDGLPQEGDGNTHVTKIPRQINPSLRNSSKIMKYSRPPKGAHSEGAEFQGCGQYQCGTYIQRVQKIERVRWRNAMCFCWVAILWWRQLSLSLSLSPPFVFLSLLLSPLKNSIS